MRINRFEDLTVWQKSLKLTKEIYNITSKGKFARDFSLRDQIRRAIISVSSNIVEGFERNNNNEFVRFLKISKGSAGEVRNQLYIAISMDYVSKRKFSKLNQEFIDLGNQIGKFITYLVKQKEKKLLTRNK